MDINVVRSKKTYLQTELANYLRDPVKYQKEITVTRGRLIRILNKEYNLETDVSIKNSIKNEIRRELENHKLQVNNRISKQNVKESMFKQIPRELGLKYRKVCANLKSIKYGNGKKEKIGGGFKAAGNVLSMGGTVLKVPIVGALKIGKGVSSTVGKIVVCPLHVPAYLFSKIINPDCKYNGRTINNMGNFLGKQVGNILDLAEQGVRRL